MRLLAFFFGWWVYRPYSAVIAAVLRLKGMRVGRNLYIQGVPYLKIRAGYDKISIGNDVSIMGGIDLRNRENGRIIIGDGTQLDNGCRLVAANDATLTIAEGCRIGAYAIFNCGDDVTVGKGTLMAAFCYIQSSNHGLRRGIPIAKQPHTYGKIVIGEDVWLAAHVSVLAGVTMGTGAVVGANAVVTHDLPAYSISVGIPAKPIGERK